ncbi:MAG TPA: cupin domain-containing protein [Gemmataceae bacterium]|jgi:mannose-6-phosphate isomerase-like protein (cupin superfamily)|nr:cupin domain-containing protein [Gemmataceae bacterium]
MPTALQSPGYSVRHVKEAPTVPCPCGQSTRIVTATDGLGCSLHVTAIRDSIRHYHRQTTEVYYILEGAGIIELNDATVDVSPGTTITIEPGTRHRLVSPVGVKTIVFSVPAFDPDDEFFD